MADEEGKVEALTSLIYNIGTGAWQRSKARSALEAGDVDTFMDQAFSAQNGWSKINGQVSQGLLNRRKMEAELFSGFSVADTPAVTPFGDDDMIGHGVLEEAQKLTIEGIVANRKLEDATGIPAEIHAEDGDEGLALMIRKAVLKENAQKAAATTEWMRRSAENAALGQKDYSSLSLAEEAINTVGALLGGAGQGFGSLIHGASKINRDVSEDMVNVLASGFSMIDENLGSAFKKGMNAKWIPWYLTPEGNVRELGKSLKYVGKELTPSNPSLFQEAVGAVGQIGAQWTIYLATLGS